MSGVLDYSRYINVFATAELVKDIFPSTQYQITVDFDQQGIDGWATTSSWTTIVVDRVRFDANRTPNFDNSTVIGYFEGGEREQSGNQITVPANMYTGAILPASDINIPISVFQIDFSKGGEIFQKTFLFIQNWEPGVAIGDPTYEPNYNPIAGLPSTLFFATYNEALLGEDYFVTAESDIPINLNGGQVRIWRQVPGNDIFLSTATFVGKKAGVLIPSYFGEDDPRNLVEGDNILYATFGGRANYGPVVSNTATQLFDPGIPLVAQLDVTPNPTNTGTTVNIQATVEIDPTYTGPLSGVGISNTVTIRLINLNTATYPVIQNQLITATTFVNNAVSGSIFITNDFIDQRLTNSSTYTVITATITTSSYYIEAFVERDYVIRVDWLPFIPGRYRRGSASEVLTVNTTMTYAGALEPVKKLRISPISPEFFQFKASNRDWQYDKNLWTASGPQSDSYYFQPNDDYYLIQQRYITGFSQDQITNEYFIHNFLGEIELPLNDILDVPLINEVPGVIENASYGTDLVYVQAQYTSTILKPIFQAIIPTVASTVTVWPLGTTAISRYKLSMTDRSGIFENAEFSFVNTSTATIYSTSNFVVTSESFENPNQRFNWIYAQDSMINSQQFDLNDTNWAGRNVYRWVRPGPFPPPETPLSQNPKQEYDWFHLATFTNTDLSVVQYDIQIERGEYPDRISFASSSSIALVEIGARFKLHPQDIKLSSTVTVRTSVFDEYVVTKKQANTIWMDPPWGYAPLTNIETNQQIPRAWWYSGEALLYQPITFENYDNSNIFITQILPVTQSEAQLNPYKLRVINALGIFEGATFYLGHTPQTRRQFTVDFVDHANNYILTLEEWYSHYASQLADTTRTVDKNSYLTTSTKTFLSTKLTPINENHFNLHNTDRDIVFTNQRVLTTATLIGFVNSTTILVDIVPNNADLNDQILIGNRLFSIQEANVNENYITLIQPWFGQIDTRTVINKTVTLIQNDFRSFGTYTFSTIDIEGPGDPFEYVFLSQAEQRPTYVPLEYRSTPRLSTTSTRVSKSINDGLNTGTYFIKYVSSLTEILFAGNPTASLTGSIDPIHYNVIEGFDIYDSCLTYSEIGTGTSTTYLITFGSAYTPVGQDRRGFTLFGSEGTTSYASYRERIPGNFPSINFNNGLTSIGSAQLIQSPNNPSKLQASIQILKSSVSTLTNISATFPGFKQLKARTVRLNGIFTSTIVMSDPVNYYNRQTGQFKIKTDILGMSKSPVNFPQATGTITYTLINLPGGQLPSVLTTQTVVSGIGDMSIDSQLISRYLTTAQKSEMVPIDILASYSGDSQRAASTATYRSTMYPTGVITNFEYPYKNDNRRFGLYTELVGFPAFATYNQLYVTLVIPKSTNGSVWNFNNFDCVLKVTDGGYVGTVSFTNQSTVLGTYSDKKTLIFPNPGNLPTNPAFRITKIIMDFKSPFLSSSLDIPYQFTSGVAKKLPIVIDWWTT